MKMCDSFMKLRCGGGWALLIARLVVAAAFIIHGLAKWPMWDALPSAEMSAGMINMMRFLSIAEPLGGLALILGVFTQLAAACLGILMIGAIYFKEMVWNVGYTSMATTGWEYDLALLALCFILFCLGGGRLALENVMCRKWCKHDGKMMAGKGDCCSSGKGECGCGGKCMCK